MTIPILRGLADIADRYDGFILDLWGVILDGETVFPDALHALRTLKAAGKRVIFLSNVPTRSDYVADLLSNLGIDHTLYHDIVSSGEAAHRALTHQTDPWFSALGSRCFFLGEDRFRSVANGLPHHLVEDVTQADFILNTGPYNPNVSLDTFRPHLDQALARQLPMVCANPDLIVVTGGQTLICAGTLAQYYEAGGGDVRYFGKPDPAIYQTCLDSLNLSDISRISAVGDAFHTDVRGARAAGLDVLFCAGGIHAVDLSLSFGDSPNQADLETLSARHGGIRPSAVIPVFRW